MLGQFDPQAAALAANCGEAQLQEAKAACESAFSTGLHALSIDDPSYPEALKRCLDLQAPPLLWYRGNRELLSRGGGSVVGARRIAQAGLECARECARVLAGLGAVLVSGGADGADLAAHEAALEAGGATIVVLPRGLRTYDPPEFLRKALAEGSALFLSGFAPDAPWATHQAVTRNATIAALSRVVCVVEPRKQGGSIRTARAALALGQPALIAFPPDHPAAEPGLLHAGAIRLSLTNHRDNKRIIAEAWRSTPSGQSPNQLQIEP